MTLTNGQRALLKRAISAAPGWREYRLARGLDASRITSGAQALQIATELGLDAAAILSGSASVNVTPRPTVAAPRNPVAASEPAKPVAPKGLFGPSATKTVVAPMGATSDDVKRYVDLKIAPVRGRVESLEQVVNSLKAPEPVVIVKNDSGAIVGKLPETRHPMAETLLRVCSARDVSGFHLGVLLKGPAGSGKTYAAKQVAETLGLDFGFHGAMGMAHELTGFVDADGNYHSTQFVERFSNGGVILLDEVDSGQNEALLALNAALANGLMSLPTGKIVARHPDCIVIAAANTWGNGPNAAYVGRNKLDAAFLSRFPVKLSWGYDENLERRICGNEAWARRVQAARAAVADAGIQHLIDPRQSIAGAALLAQGLDADTVASITYLAGLDDAQANIIETAARRAR